MIDFNNAKKVFYRFVADYDTENPFIILKYKHTLRVMDNCQNIAETLFLNQEEKELAILIGLLHDLGRFEQVKLFGSFDEHKINHAKLGIKILFEKNLIREFITDTKYDDLIKDCIYFHNEHTIDENLSEKTKMFVKILRDADKIDIYKAMIDAECFDYEVSEMPNQKVLDDILNERSVDLKNVYNTSDWRAVPFGYIYDINYKYSFIAIKNKDYYNQYAEKLIIKDANIKDLIEKIRIQGNQYLDIKTK